MVLLVSYYTKLKPRGVYCLVWCLVCDFRYSPTLTHPDLPAQNAHNFFVVLHLTQNSSAMGSSDPKLSIGDRRRRWDSNGDYSRLSSMAQLPGSAPWLSFLAQLQTQLSSGQVGQVSQASHPSQPARKDSLKRIAQKDSLTG